MWSDSYLSLSEANFDRIFMEIYEEEFIDCIFEHCESTIDKETFVKAITGALTEDAKCEWLFNPSVIRKIY